ncbi:MAG: hypothetical protein DMD81_16520 [Candidatus Rokuibacteriota bacterium]|nr:MAG: hypothetical protein DMD81_16520 [Candidatus Rokubacteria bacterium]
MSARSCVKERKTAHPKLAERVRAKRIYEPAEPDDGTRILIMRLWPRGIRRDRVDLWLRELGPVLPLMRAFRSGQLDWANYRRQYLAGLERAEAQEQVEQALALARKGPVTVLCGCPDETRCHRSLLRGYLTEHLL